MTVTGPVLLGDRYELKRRLASGGMAEVFLAHDRVLDRPVAVKVMRAGLEIPHAHQRFTHEARTLAQLRHPNLVTLLDAGTTEDRPFLVMELVDGQTLAERCSGHALPERQVTRIGGAIASALEHVHASGVVHRDVKPGNVLLASDGRVLLSDFGIAKLLDGSSALTQTALTLGSPPYLSPEQVRGQQVTPASDVYSLGLVLVEALTGRQAFTGPAVEAAMARLVNPPEIPAGLPGDWQGLLADMFVDDVDARPTAAEVATRLGSWTSDDAAPQITATTKDLSRRGRGPSRWPSKPRCRRPENQGQPPPARRPVALIASIAVLLLAVALIAIVVRSSSSTASKVPNDLPQRIGEPLESLHQAVEQAP